MDHAPARGAAMWLAAFSLTVAVVLQTIGMGAYLAITEPKLHNAIHGLVRWAGWQPAERGTALVSWPIS